MTIQLGSTSHSMQAVSTAHTLDWVKCKWRLTGPGQVKSVCRLNWLTGKSSEEVEGVGHTACCARDPFQSSFTLQQHNSYLPFSQIRSGDDMLTRVRSDFLMDPSSLELRKVLFWVSVWLVWRVVCVCVCVASMSPVKRGQFHNRWRAETLFNQATHTSNIPLLSS